MDIRRYRPEDFQAVHDLHVRGLASAGIVATEGPWMADLDDVEGTYLAGGEFLIGTIDGKMVAMGALKPVTVGRGEIKRVRVEPALQGQGYGQKILSLLEEKARELGFTVLQLDIAEDNKISQHFFEKNGYKEVRRGFTGHYSMIFCEKDLSDSNA